MAMMHVSHYIEQKSRIMDTRSLLYIESCECEYKIVGDHIQSHLRENSYLNFMGRFLRGYVYGPMGIAYTRSRLKKAPNLFYPL